MPSGSGVLGDATVGYPESHPLKAGDLAPELQRLGDMRRGTQEVGHFGRLEWTVDAPMWTRCAILRFALPSVFLLLGLWSCTTERTLSADAPQANLLQSLSGAPRLPPTRYLRRLSLTLRGHEPEVAQYEAAMAASDGGTFDAFIAREIDSALGSPDFYEQMVSYGHEYLRVGDYKRGSNEGLYGQNWRGNMASQVKACPAGTRHAGALAMFHAYPDISDDAGVCDAPSAPLASVEPWWAPGTSVQVIGHASNLRSKLAPDAGGTDCGVLNCGETTCLFPRGGCGCGPNLQYCQLYEEDRPGYEYASMRDSIPNFANASRRQVWEEPARLFAYVITQDQPFSDLVVGSYTVAPRKLRHHYVRWGRQNETNGQTMDTSGWWRMGGDSSWERVEVSTLHPNLLSQRDYKFDPRVDGVDGGSPKGIGAAGVFTQLAPNSWFPRERVRAARWLEIFACRNFSAPDPSVVFNPPFKDDPARQGACQYCHTTIDPAAIHFKRLEIEESQAKHGLGVANLGGVGSFQWKLSSTVSFPDINSPGGIFWYQPYGRWHVSFIPNTFLTPITPAQLQADPDTRFIDFLPPSETLFGQVSDGTIGPLGFGKLLVQSGEFDRCAVNRIFEHFMGRKLDVTREAATEAALVKEFTNGGRKVKPLVRALMLSDEFRSGL